MRALKEAVAYVQAVTLTMFFVGRLDLAEAERWGLAETLEQLAVAVPASREGWQLLARVIRHVVAELEEQGDPRLLIAAELLDEVMARVDRMAAPRRRKGA
jgi:hypothetical protein